MWILFAVGAALFAGLTSILAKSGIRHTDSNVATAIRTVVVLIFSWMMVFVVGSYQTLAELDGRTLLFLVLSGLATGASWLCYFRALQIGNINQVVVVDKSSIILIILFSFVFLREPVSPAKIAGVLGIGAGTYLMIEKKQVQVKTGGGRWLVFAGLSAVFASLTTILGKVGITGIESNLGTAIRTGVVLLMAWLVVFMQKKQREVRRIPVRELCFICLSGVATGASWLCYYKALQEGPASIVAPIDKLSILVTAGFSYLVFKERLSRRAMAGLGLVVAGTLAMLF